MKLLMLNINPPFEITFLRFTVLLIGCSSWKYYHYIFPHSLLLHEARSMTLTFCKATKNNIIRPGIPIATFAGLVAFVCLFPCHWPEILNCYLYQGFSLSNHPYWHPKNVQYWLVLASEQHYFLSSVVFKQPTQDHQSSNNQNIYYSALNICFKINLRNKRKKIKKIINFECTLLFIKTTDLRPQNMFVNRETLKISVPWM